VRHADKAVLLLLLLTLIGCAARPQRIRAPVPDWQSEEHLPRPVDSPVPVHVATNSVPAPVELPSSAKETWVSLSRWCHLNGLAAPSQLGKISYALTTTGGVFVITAGSQVAQWDGVDLRLGFAPRMSAGQPLVHNLDLEKTILPLITTRPDVFSPVQQPTGTLPVIVIDAGHGGEDSGTKSVLGNASEKDFTLDWARRLAAILSRDGWNAILTRTNDTELSLSSRVLLADTHQADLFISLHFNSAAPNEAEAGLETYCLTPTGVRSTVTRGYEDEPTLAFPNNAFDAQNLYLAARVHRELLQVNGRLDRGVRRARFLTVLRGQQRPAILIEGGYLSNPREARLIAEPSYRQKLAEAVAKTLETRQSLTTSSQTNSLP
jgi:N-acetylmuramoyl-L-alanine amidase